jgi:choline dehydrogenase-like flavoprotein
MRHLPDAAATGTRLLHARCLSRPKLPGLFIRNAARRYALQYHAEQSPNRDSRASLSDQRDGSGLQRLKVDLRYQEVDARSVVENHRIIDRCLCRAGLGELSYRLSDGELVASVLAQARDGVHQIGTTRMSTDPRLGIVDADCRVHGTQNLFVAGSSTFPTSSQANPTFLAAALSARLAHHIADILSQLAEPTWSPRKRDLAVLTFSN